MSQDLQGYALIFDFGGVLADWNPYYLFRKLLPDDEAVQAFLEEVDFKRWNLMFDQGFPTAEVVAEWSARYPQRAELIRAFDERWLETSGEMLMDTVAILIQLKKAGYPIYGLSNWSAEKFALVKKRFEFLNYMDDYVLSGAVKQIKPGLEIFRILLERIHRPAGECIFIDDSAENIRAAQQVGLKTILFTDAPALVEQLKEFGIVVSEAQAG